jgi:hypothetical protein
VQPNTGVTHGTEYERRRAVLRLVIARALVP